MLGFLPTTAAAWDGWKTWNEAADGMNPGGGGIFGTGGATDHAITCAHCHVEAKGMIGGGLTFNPPLSQVGGVDAYQPGKIYQVTATLTGERLGLSGCAQYTMNNNGFVATFENSSGTVAGVLASDSGQSSASCPPTLPSDPTGTTVVVGDCHAILPLAQENVTTWNFSWTAPLAGTGTVTAFYGIVDGDCGMSSYLDDVKLGSFTLSEGLATRWVKPRESDTRLASAHEEATGAYRKFRHPRGNRAPRRRVLATASAYRSAPGHVA
jgi:hypothetical protein